MSDTRTQILDLAEASMRARGYHAVSFRDLADALGIKSASIHYHFRHKEDLGLAMVDRYASRVSEALGPASTHPWPEALASFTQVYKNALRANDLQCLCGMLAAESPGLPGAVADRVKAFYEANISWLIAAMPEDAPNKRETALGIQAEIQGAMTLAVSLRDPGVLDEIAERISAKA